MDPHIPMVTALFILDHANIVHCGDLVFNRRHPYVDRGCRGQYQKLDGSFGKRNE